jgi:protein-S-isoprenylcysteine O-methyltransferase Ste14
MAGLRPRANRFAPSGRATTALVLLLAWVAIAASGAGPDSDESNWLDLPRFGWLGYVLGVLAVIVLVVTVSTAIFSRKQVRTPRQAKRQSIWPMLVLILILLVLVQTEPGEPVIPPEAPAAASGPRLPDESVELPELTAGRSDVATLAIIALLAGALMVMLRKPPAATSPRGDEPQPESLEPAIERAVADLTLGDDPRSAVLLAYHGVEGALADRELPRSPTETPTEHIARVLGRVDPNPALTEPLLGLARLYELARFSDHAITAADQRSAAESLRRVRAEVAGP